MTRANPGEDPASCFYQSSSMRSGYLVFQSSTTVSPHWYCFKLQQATVGHCKAYLTYSSSKKVWPYLRYQHLDSQAGHSCLCFKEILTVSFLMDIRQSSYLPSCFVAFPRRTSCMPYHPFCLCHLQNRTLLKCHSQPCYWTQLQPKTQYLRCRHSTPFKKCASLKAKSLRNSRSYSFHQTSKLLARSS